MKKAFAIYLDEDQESFLKVRFNIRTDAELRNILERIAISMISQQRDIEREDLLSMRQASKIRG